VTVLTRLRILSGPEVTEGFRNRRQLLIRAATPLVLLLTLSGLVAFSGRTQRLADDEYVIAVEGDITGARGTLATLEHPPTLETAAPPPLVFVAADDAALEVTRSADAGLRVPPGLDASLARGDTARVGIFTDHTERPSRAAASLLRAALFERLAPRPGELAVVATGVEEREGTPGVDEGREQLGRGVAAFVLLQGAVLVGAAAIRLTGRRATGNLVPQLLLPVPRLELVAGRGVSELVLGLVTGLPLLALVTVPTVVLLVADGDVALAALVVVLVPLTAAAVAAPLIATGLVIGIRARSAQQVSGLTAGSLVVVSLAARFVSQAGEEQAGVLAAVPLVGPAHVLRQAIDGQFEPLGLVVALLSTIAVTWILLRLASNLIGGDHLALRSA
jgi:hypothetical protein